MSLIARGSSVGVMEYGEILGDVRKKKCLEMITLRDV